MQGAVAADGVGNLLSGLMGTVPNTTYSTSISVTELTGVAARSVGVAVGVVFVAAAFLPKVLAAVLAIPGPVVAAYVTVLLSVLFVLGMTVVIQDGIDYRKGLVAGVSFLDRGGLPARSHLPRLRRGRRRRAFPERNDRGRPRGHPDDRVSRALRPAPAPVRGGSRRLRPAEDAGVPRCVRGAERLGRGDGGPPGRGGRGDPADPARGGGPW